MSDAAPVRAGGGEVGRIARRELLQLRRDGRGAFAVVLVVLLLATALAVGWQQRATAEAEREAAQRFDYRDWLAQGERHPHDAAHQGLHVFKPQPPLALADPGVLPYTGSTLWLQSHRQSELSFRPAQDATGLQRFGALTVAWVLQVLCPLLLIVLGFDALAGERERGTLRQTLSLGVTLRQVCAGKALALSACAQAFACVALGAAAMVASATGSAQDAAEAARRFPPLLLAYAVYLQAVVFVVLGVSTLAGTSRAALAWLLGLWILGAALAPRIGADLARAAYPSPSRVSFATELERSLKDSYRDAWVRAFGTERRWGRDVPLARWGEALRIDDQAGYGASDRVYVALWESYARQQRVQEQAGTLVPLLAIRGVSMALSGTDFEASRRFSVAAEGHRRLMQDLISADLMAHADKRGAGHFDYTAGRELWAKVPEFVFEHPGVLDAVRHARTGIVALLASLALAAAFAAWALARGARRMP